MSVCVCARARALRIVSRDNILRFQNTSIKNALITFVAYTSTFQCREEHDRGCLVECCFTSTETVGLLGTGAHDVHIDFHTAPELWVALSHCVNI